MPIAQTLSVLICCALSTAITGAPVAVICTLPSFASMVRATESIPAMSFPFLSVSLEPYGESIITIAKRLSGAKM